MVKTAQRKVKKTVHPVSNDNSYLDENDSTAATTAINNNVSAQNANVLQDDHKKSSVWKYATKIAPDKARCDTCAIGKPLEHGMLYYVLSKIT